MCFGMCKKCSKLSALIVLVVGILFLVRDLGGWDFWGISWWTAAFVLAGLAGMGCSGCKECCGACDMDKKKSKK